MKEQFQPIVLQDRIENSLPPAWNLMDVELLSESKLHQKNTQNLHNNLHIHHPHHHRHPLHHPSQSNFSGFSVYNNSSSNSGNNNNSHHNHTSNNSNNHYHHHHHNNNNYHNNNNNKYNQMVPMMNPYGVQSPIHFFQLHSTLNNLSEKLSAQEEKLLMLQSIARENEEKFKEIENQLCTFTKNINELYGENQLE